MDHHDIGMQRLSGADLVAALNRLPHGSVTVTAAPGSGYSWLLEHVPGATFGGWLPVSPVPVTLVIMRQALTPAAVEQCQVLGVADAAATIRSLEMFEALIIAGWAAES